MEHHVAQVIRDWLPLVAGVIGIGFGYLIGHRDGRAERVEHEDWRPEEPHVTWIEPQAAEPWDWTNDSTFV